MIDAETDKARFEEFFCPVRPVLRAFLYAATRNVHDADDLMQQVGAVLWRKFEQFDPSRPFAAWAVGFAQMEVRKWRDRASRSGRFVSISDDAVAALADACAQATPENETPTDEVEALRDCIDRLAPAAKQAIELKYRQGLPISEIAALQSREVGAVEMALVRARRALRQCVDGKVKLIQRGRTARHV